MTNHSLPDDILEGAIDMHVHSAPDLIDRYGTDLELAHEAMDANMHGVLVKSHVLPTVGRVDLINDVLGANLLYGGVALNGSVGGLNPDAVEVALDLGASVIWLPTAWSANHAQIARAAGTKRFVGQRVPNPDEELPVAVNGTVAKSVQEIIELVAEYDAVLGTGHASSTEIEAVVAACADAGARCLVNHPFFRIVDLPIETQRRLARQGAVMEYCAYAIESTEGHTVERVVEAVEQVGPEHAVLATDFGQRNNPPVEGLEQFARDVHAAGLSRETVRTLLSETPARVLGV